MDAKEKNQLIRERMGKAGGQALIEGIMMNGPTGAAIAVRRADGSVIVKPKTIKHARDAFPPAGWPFVRGIVNFVESMILGYKSLMESAELSGQLEAEEDTENMSKLDKWINDHLGPKMLAVISAISMVLGFVIAFGLFVYLPSFLVRLADEHLFSGGINGIGLRPLIEGLIRIVIFVGYMIAVSQMKDIKRVFMYHGAEHKTIFCYENGDELTVENVRKYRRFHPRCGTSFIFVTLILSILASSLLAVILNVTGASLGGRPLINVTWAWSLIKILVLPVVVGISYEFIRYAGRHENLCTKVLSAPGLWMQRITTKEPEDAMIEVGIASLRATTEGWDEERILTPDGKAQADAAPLPKELDLSAEDFSLFDKKPGDEASPEA